MYNFKRVLFISVFFIMSPINVPNADACAAALGAVLCKKPTVPQSFLGRLSLCAGIVESAEDVLGARNPSYKMVANFGAQGPKISVGQFVHTYKKSELVGKTIWGITNFEPRRIAGIKSEYLTVGFYNLEHHAMCLNTLGEIMAPGTLIHPEISKDEPLSFDAFLALEIIVGRVTSFDETSTKAMVDFGLERGLHAVSTNAALGIPPSTFVGKLATVFVNGDVAPEVVGIHRDDRLFPLCVDEKDIEIPLGSDLG